LKLDFEKRDFLKDKENINITQKEFLILEYLYKNEFKVVTRTELIEYVW
jgi:DNA-binding response OmpR family regulator